MNSGDANALLARCALRGVDACQPSIEFGQRTLRDAREIFEHFVCAQTLRNTCGAAMRRECLFEIDLGAQHTNGIGGSRGTVVTSRCFEENRSERAQFNARAAVKSRHLVQVIVETNVRKREPRACAVAQQ